MCQNKHLQFQCVRDPTTGATWGRSLKDTAFSLVPIAEQFTTILTESNPQIFMKILPFAVAELYHQKKVQNSWVT
jgi:hypothetical protein